LDRAHAYEAWGRAFESLRVRIFQQGEGMEFEINGDGVPEVSPESVRDQVGNLKLIDVRRPDEFKGELGHIAGSVLVTLGSELESYLESLNKSDTYVFVCRSGARSSTSTLMAQSLGFSKVFNMKGGMLRWNALGFPIEK